MIWGVVTFPVFLLSAYSLGEWLRRRILGGAAFTVNRIARALAFGLVAHGILMTVLGFTWLLHPWIAATVTGLPAIILWPVWWRDIRELFRKSTWKPKIGLTPVEIVFLVLAIGLTLIRGFNALAPNVSWDATSHHYLVPSVWLDTGRVSDLPSVVFSYYPSLVEMGIAGTMAFGTDFLSNLYGWLYGILAIAILVGIGSRHFDGKGPVVFKWAGREYRMSPGRFAGITAAFLFTLFPGVGVQTDGGYVDLPLACWVLMSLDLILEFRINPRWPVLIAGAIFAGACLSTKHLALILFPGLVVYLIWATLSKRKDSEIGIENPWRYIFAFIGIALLLALPWYIRSVWLTGNPLYPFGIFGLPTPPQPPFTSASWVRPDYQRSLGGFLTYWLHLTFEPTVGHALGRNYSLTFPLLLPLIIWIPRLKPSGRVLALLAGFSVLVIYAFFPIETRYHLPFIAPIALIYGLLAAQLLISKPEWWTGILLLIGTSVMTIYLMHEQMVLSFYREIDVYLIARRTINLTAISALFMIFAFNRNLRTMAVFILLLAVGVGSYVFDIQKDLDNLEVRHKVVLNRESEDAYMLRMSPRNYGSIHYINTQMDWREMRILCLEPRVYRLKADWVTWFGLEESTVPTTPAENVAVWYRGGFTHILIGDDVQVKALMYYNIVHMGGWDVPGATPQEMIDYLHEHPDEDTVHFALPDLWTNFEGERFIRNRHFTHYWLPREIEKERYPMVMVDGNLVYEASRLDILTDPERVAQYAFIRDFRELVDSGGLKIVWDDELVYLFECDYPAYLESHPDVDLETLGLE